MAGRRDLDRHSWCGAFAARALSAGSKDEVSSLYPGGGDLRLPVSVLQLDPADRAVLRIAGNNRAHGLRLGTAVSP